MNNTLIDDSRRIIKISSYASGILFLFAHIAYLVFFIVIDVPALIYINIGSVVFYFLMLLFIRFRLYNLYVILTALEIAIYMTVATMLLGHETGFNICLVALGSLEFFAGYFSKFGKSRIKPIIFSLANMTLFTFTYFWLKYHNPSYAIDDLYKTILFITHIIITFGFSTSFLAILTTYTVKLENRVQKESVTDKLTNIPNRKGLSEYYDRLGDQKSNYILAIFDIDNFKKFNDKNGHLCGDYVLKEIARIAEDNSKDDFVSRWGGEEFVIIAKKDENLKETYNRIDKIRINIEQYSFNYSNKNLKSTITIGVQDYEENLSLDEWIKKADSKLYKGKQNGKNQIVI